MYVYSKEGKELERLAADFIGSMYVSRRQKQTWLFVTMTGFTTPGMSGRYDFTAPEGQRWSWYSKTKVSGLNPDEFEAQQVSHRVPLVVAWCKEIRHVLIYTSPFSRETGMVSE